MTMTTTTVGITTATTRLASTAIGTDIKTAWSAASTIACRDTATTTRAACGKTPAVTSTGWARAAATSTLTAAGMRMVTSEATVPMDIAAAGTAIATTTATTTAGTIAMTGASQETENRAAGK